MYILYECIRIGFVLLFVPLDNGLLEAQIKLLLLMNLYSALIILIIFHDIFTSSRHRPALA